MQGAGDGLVKVMSNSVDRAFLPQTLARGQPDLRVFPAPGASRRSPGAGTQPDGSGFWLQIWQQLLEEDY
jgi:hypothetical protein